MDQATIKTNIESILRETSKNVDDIKYVSYYIGNYLQTRQEFYCSYDEFINIMGDQFLSNMKWLYDIKLVSNDWWITFDGRGDWYMHSYPIQPKKSRIPEVHLLINNILSNDEY